MTTDLFVLRTARRRRRRIRIALGVATALAVLLGGLWTVFESPVLTVDEVRVTGLEHLERKKVVTAAAVPDGVPLVRVDTAAVAARVSELDAVEEVDVRRSWPRTLVVHVRERTAVAWTMRNGQRWAVDAEGVVHRKLSKKPKGLPEIQVKGDGKRAMGAAAAVAGSLVEFSPGFAPDVVLVQARSKDSVELRLAGGQLVVWGSADHAEQKAASLDALLTIKARRYDVSAPERPTTTE